MHVCVFVCTYVGLPLTEQRMEGPVLLGHTVSVYVCMYACMHACVCVCVYVCWSNSDRERNGRACVVGLHSECVCMHACIYIGVCV